MSGLDLLMKLIDMITGGKSSPKQEVMDYLEDKGYSSEAIAGITANIEVETGGTFDYKEQEKGKGKGEGLFQYTDTMKDSYKDYLKKNKINNSMETQIDFMDEVVRGTWSPGLSNMDKSILKGELFSGKNGPDRIAESFNSIFEKGKLETDYGNRKNIAMDIYKSM